MDAEPVDGGDDVAQLLAADGAVAVGVVQREDPAQFVGDGAARQRRNAQHQLLKKKEQQQQQQ